ncbi:MAG: 3-isopropylmalate dehydratase small subunit [Gammaproteobacteria bacterium]|nr:3-isopropylmalate dehydratase small subunit [Gammaproteobacteria bacterium]MCZ6497631.1 3-isopropylmalate dehydratase small subunit [Gammaproteobacteria bacterium]MCZ6584781.1 3-isopropylmalate dehydratase small subunit [Gammaproteobacteria bacterium]
MKPLTRISSRTAVLALTDVDTDQIIPARYLTTTVRQGLGQHLFADWRYAADGSAKADFVLNQPDAEGAAALIVGRNFGCGSSREHAPWALLDYGFEVVISTEIADIFLNNSLKNGLIPVIVDEEIHRWLLDHPGVEISVDIDTLELVIPEHDPIPFNIDRFSRYCLLNGIDQLGFLLQHDAAIDDYEARTR